MTKEIVAGLIAAIGIGVLLSAAAIVACGPQAADLMVEFMFANVRVPPGNRPEPPPTVFPHPQSSLDIKALGGRGSGLNCSIDPFIDWLVFRVPRGREAISLILRQACITLFGGLTTGQHLTLSLRQLTGVHISHPPSHAIAATIARVRNDVPICIRKNSKPVTIYPIREGGPRKPLDLRRPPLPHRAIA